jgi:hypothetical protein
MGMLARQQQQLQQLQLITGLQESRLLLHM